MSKASFFAGFIIGLALSGAAFAADRIGVTDVRVGPTAAIGITTSADGRTVYVVNGNVLFKSSDGGSSWSKLQAE